MSDAALFTTVREPLSPYSPHLTEAQKSESEFCEETVTKVATSRFPRLAKASAAVRTFVQKTNMNQLFCNVLILVAAYPIAKLILTLITGAALTLTPANIVLIAAAALFLIATIVAVVRCNSIRCSKLDHAKFFFIGMFRFAVAPIIAPFIVFDAARKGFKALRPKASG